MLAERRLLVLSPVAMLIGCAQATSQRLAMPDRRLDSVLVFVWGAGDEVFGGAGAQRFVETLQRNGLPVSGILTLDRPLQDLAALEHAWASAPAQKRGTYALVLTRQRLDTHGAARYVRYEAVLWSSASRQLTWQASLASLANLLGRSTQQRAEILGGDVLRGLARDGFVAPMEAGPRDAAGTEIPATLIPLQIR